MPTTTRRRNRRRGQALVEFAMVIGAFVTVVIGSFYFGTVLFQNWENGRFAEWAGKDVTINGSFNSQNDIAAQASTYNIDLSNITVSVTIVHIDSSGTMHTLGPCNVRTSSGSGQIPGIGYGDYVSVVVQSVVNIPILSNFMSDKSSAPAASGKWTGNSQLDHTNTPVCL